MLCQNDFALTIQTGEGQKEACYLLHIEGLAKPLSLTLTGNDTQKIQLSNGAYASGTALRLRLEKTCPESAALSFSVSFHL